MGGRVRAIVESSGYLQDNDDPDFLDRYETRGMRLGLDYLKPEVLLQQRGVEHTIVVFGSTRALAQNNGNALARRFDRAMPGAPGWKGERTTTDA